MANLIAQLNQATEAEFVEVLGTLFEHTPEIARKAWNYRPFADIAAIISKNG